MSLYVGVSCPKELNAKINEAKIRVNFIVIDLAFKNKTNPIEYQFQIKAPPNVSIILLQLLNRLGDLLQTIYNEYHTHTHTHTELVNHCPFVFVENNSSPFKNLLKSSQFVRSKFALNSLFLWRFKSITLWKKLHLIFLKIK